jgi:hypothetical protein
MSSTSSLTSFHPNVYSTSKTEPGYFMNCLLRQRIWPSFLASSGVGPCYVPLRYASAPIPRYRGTVSRWHAHLRGLATAIHVTTGLVLRASLCMICDFRPALWNSARTRNFEQQKYLKAVGNVFYFDILRFLVLRFCGSYFRERHSW